MATLLAILGFLKAVLDFLNPWSQYWVGKRRNIDAKRSEAGKKLDESAKKEGDYDSFIDGLNDSNNP